ncbi:MAG TPA: hypothetical protein EYH31_07160 [Anaerolineae bacterium]|nr:hypothetical protein [Anaerolineae bacterium]
MLRPKLKLLETSTVERVVDEAIQLLWEPGVQVHHEEALTLLGDAGSTIDRANKVAHIPAELAYKALETAPKSFHLYNAAGEPTVHYGDDDVHFDPGSAAIVFLDYETGEARAPKTADFVQYVKLADSLLAMDAVSTALVCSDVPQGMADLYRLYLVLRYSDKPIVTGAFAVETWATMHEMLATVAGGSEALAEKPRAVFDVCPSPPLLWSEITCANLIDCARAGVPAELVSMPLAGATGPATLIGSVVQHAAESLSGIVIHQLAKAGSPIVWGGSPAVFDMRAGTTPMGAIETMMIDAAYAQVGKHLEIPTHAYMALSDSKLPDAQAGLETGIGAVIAALAGINMVSGPGMLAFESAFSLEKLVIDAEITEMARRMIRGVDDSEEPLALDLIRQVGHAGDFLRTRHTRSKFRQEQYIPSPVIDRNDLDSWKKAGATDAVQRAHEVVEQKIAGYQPKELPGDALRTLEEITLRAAQTNGLERLPPLNE